MPTVNMHAYCMVTFEGHDPALYASSYARKTLNRIRDQKCIAMRGQAQRMIVLNKPAWTRGIAHINAMIRGMNATEGKVR